MPATSPSHHRPLQQDLRLPRPDRVQAPRIQPLLFAPTRYRRLPWRLYFHARPIFRLNKLAWPIALKIPSPILCLRRRFYSACRIFRVVYAFPAVRRPSTSTRSRSSFARDAGRAPYPGIRGALRTTVCHAVTYCSAGLALLGNTASTTAHIVAYALAPPAVILLGSVDRWDRPLSHPLNEALFLSPSEEDGTMPKMDFVGGSEKSPELSPAANRYAVHRALFGRPWTHLDNARTVEIYHQHAARHRLSAVSVNAQLNRYRPRSDPKLS